ncbi:MAG: transposase, partial [Pseudomonadota bacterium]
PAKLHDSKTVKTTVEIIESRYGKADRVWVMDRGMISEATLTWMREGGRRYVVGLPKSELKKHAAELADSKGWKIVRDGVAVRYAQAISDETGACGDLLLLCRSDDRREKEMAMQGVLPVSGPDFRVGALIFSPCRPAGATGRNHGKREERKVGGYAGGCSEVAGTVRTLAGKQGGCGGANSRETLGSRRETLPNSWRQSCIQVAEAALHDAEKAVG